MYRSRVMATASITLAFALGAMRAGAALPQVDISGFGTGGFAITDNGKAEFGRSQQQLVGANNEGDVGVDSLFALQGTVHFTDMFSATVQRWCGACSIPASSSTYPCSSPRPM